MKKKLCFILSFLIAAAMLCACAKPGEGGTTAGSGLPTAEELFEEVTKDDPEGWFTENSGFIYDMIAGDFDFKEGRAFKTDKGIPTFYYYINTEDGSAEWFNSFVERFEGIIAENKLAERGNASWYITVMYHDELSGSQVGSIAYLVLDGKEYSEAFPTEPEYSNGMGEIFEDAYNSNLFFSNINTEDIDSLAFSKSSAE